MKEVLLVDEQDQEIGRIEKIKAHEEALLHRAFSIFLYHGDQVLLQKRSANKYHCPGLWTNSCCSHPLEGEVIPYALQRLYEETGIRVDHLTEVGTLLYRAEFGNGLWEYEYDHLLIGEYEGDISDFDEEEIEEVRWISVEELKKEIAESPSQFTPWLKQSLNQIIEAIQK